MSSDPEQRSQELSDLFSKGNTFFKEAKYREALIEYGKIKAELNSEELADNWQVIQQMGLCEYQIGHKKEAYHIWMSLEQNPLELFVFVTERLQQESTLLLPELLTTFPKFRFLYYITVERLLKTERLELLDKKIDNCPHPFDQWLLQGMQSLFFVDTMSENNYLERWKSELSNMIEYTSQQQFQSSRDLMELCFTTLYHFHASYLLNYKVSHAILWSNVVRKIYPSIDYTSYKCLTDLSDTSGVDSRKIKVCFVNCFANELHSVTRDRAGIIIKLHPHKFEKHLVYLDQPVQKQGLVTALMNSVPAENHHPINSAEFLFEPGKIIETLRDLQFDVIVFQELGMNPVSYLLAHCRLAPKQITTWGHSITSGISTVDYYFSSKWFEPLSNQRYYSEKLLLMDSLGTYYPTINPPEPSREYIERLKLPENAKIICCMQNYFKLQSEWFQVMQELLRENKDYILLLQIPLKTEKTGGIFFEQKYQAQLKNLLGDLSQIRFIETLPYNVYLQLLQQCDLIVDPYPFGGCNTSLDSFVLGKMVITRTSPKLPGRFTTGFYRKMDITEPVCNSMSEYKNKIHFYLENQAERKKIEDRIKENVNRLFLEQASVDEWELVLTKLAKDENPFTSSVYQDKQQSEPQIKIYTSELDGDQGDVTDETVKEEKEEVEKTQLEETGKEDDDGVKTIEEPGDVEKDNIEETRKETEQEVELSEMERKKKKKKKKLLEKKKIVFEEDPVSVKSDSKIEVPLTMSEREELELLREKVKILKKKLKGGHSD